MYTTRILRGITNNKFEFEVKLVNIKQKNIFQFWFLSNHEQKITIFMIWAFIFVLWPLKLDDRPGDIYGTSKNRVRSCVVVGDVVD